MTVPPFAQATAYVLRVDLEEVADALEAERDAFVIAHQPRFRLMEQALATRALVEKVISEAPYRVLEKRLHERASGLGLAPAHPEELFGQQLSLGLMQTPPATL